MPLSRADFLSRWSDLHEGIDPGGVPFVRGWLAIVYVAARPLAAARVAPSVVTVVGLVIAAAVPVVSGVGGRWPWAATALVLLSGLLDSLDGAVAVMTDRVGRWGAWLDAVCDRLADAAYGVALWVLGAPAWVTVGWVGLSALAEYARARAQALLAGPVDVVTVGERPTRIIVTVATLVAAGAAPGRADDAALVGGVVGVLTAAVGLAQITLAVRRRLA